LIAVRGHVASQAGVAVPMPDTTNVGTLFQNGEVGEAGLSEDMSRGDSRHAGADDHNPGISAAGGRLVGLGRMDVRTLCLPKPRRQELSTVRRRLRRRTAAISVMALAGGTGVARAQPEPNSPRLPPVIDQLIASTAALWVDPRDKRGHQPGWGRVGMYCENLFARCR
jgi:hypothetical protein